MPEEDNALRSGITAGFSKTLNEVLQIGPKIRYWIQNKVRPVLLTGILKGSQGTPGLVAAISAEQDSPTGRIRLSVSQATALRGKTILRESDSIANGTQTVYTVPTGKIFYLMQGQLSTLATGAGFGQLYIDTTATRLLRLDASFTAVNYIRDGQSETFVFPFPVPLTAGQAIIVSSSAATITSYANVIGWLEYA